jgi:TonB family protein
MKTKLFFLTTLFLISFGCKEEKNEIEIIPDYDRIYLPPNQLTETPQLLKGNDKILLDSMLQLYGKLYGAKYADSKRNKDMPTMEYKFMIDESGAIEKIFIGNNNDEKINKFVLTSVKDWKFKPATKDGKIVKSQYPIILWFESDKPINENNYAPVVENMPGPIGGMYAIQEKIIYPEIAKRAGIQGKVIIQAFIDENGNVVHVKVLSGIGGGCDEMAVDAVKKTKFNPGMQDGKNVKVQVTIPIVFKLQ